MGVHASVNEMAIVMEIERHKGKLVIVNYKTIGGSVAATAAAVTAIVICYI